MGGSKPGDRGAHLCYFKASISSLESAQLARTLLLCPSRSRIQPSIRTSWSVVRLSEVFGDGGQSLGITSRFLHNSFVMREVESCKFAKGRILSSHSPPPRSLMRHSAWPILGFSGIFRTVPLPGSWSVEVRGRFYGFGMVFAK